jgi:hypothetical protein
VLKFTSTPSQKSLCGILNRLENRNDLGEQPKLLRRIEAILLLIVGFLLAHYIIEKRYPQLSLVCTFSLARLRQVPI